jgi:hypothetical protein
MKTTKLERLNACSDAVEYVETQKSPALAWQNCDRGDWMLWMAKKLNVDDRLLTLAKATCSNQVRHLMKDQQSTDALDACFRYAKGEITREELNVFTDAAYTTAVFAFAAHAAYSAAQSSFICSYYAASYAAAAYADAATDADDAKRESLKKSADICREILTEEVLSKYKKLR